MHKQDDTEHNSSANLEVPDSIDIIIGEVKAKGQRLAFNKSMRREESFESWQKLLSWIGLLTDEQIYSASIELNSLVQTQENSSRKSFLTTKIIETQCGNVFIRPIIFSPERESINNADKFVGWTEVNDFLWLCLCPNEKRDKCGSRYDFTSWGHGLSEIVRAYKRRQREGAKFETIDELYQDIILDRQQSE